MNEIPQPPLDRMLADLAQEVAPPGHLWPRIAARLDTRRRIRAPLALAAGIALAAAGLASLFTWAMLQGPSVPRVIQTVAASGSFEESRDPKYLLARDMAQKTFRERLELLEPKTREKIQSSLAVIQQAHEDIRKALIADPHSPVLEQLWASTWHDEFDLYDSVLQATQPSMTRT